MIRLIFFILIGLSLSAQDTAKFNLIQPTDSLETTASSKDSMVLRGTQLYISSKDSIDEPVVYSAKDSIMFELSKKLIHLYGSANIKYQTMELKADYIVIDMNIQELEARPRLDSLKRPQGIPKFKDGDQTFDAQNIRYNFKTKKGVVKEVISKESDIFIHGEVSKFISKDAEGSTENTVFNSDGIFTTCDAQEPHFGIHSAKQKIIPNKLIIIGPSIVKIHGIPTPLALPFGFFPISKNKTSGLIIPNNYSFNPRYGFGLQGIGYYIPINDYVDEQVKFDIWFKGSFSVNSITNYTKRYKYQGNANITYQNLNAELPNDYRKAKVRNFIIKLSHNQQQGAHPYRRIGGSVDFALNPSFRQVNRDARSVLNNTIGSTFSLSYQIPNSIFSYSLGLTHSQNLNNRSVRIDFPTFDFNMRPINPFKNKNKISQTEKWYEKITLNYNSKVRSSIQSYDSILFVNPNWDDLRYGARHSASMDVNFKLLKYFNVVPNINYSEEWFFKDIKKGFNPDTIYIYDAKDPSKITDTVFGKQDTTASNKFGALREFSTGVRVGTQIYGQALVKKGWFRGIRHVMSPSFGLSFSPNYHTSPFNYFRSINTDSRPQFDKQEEYLRFYNSPFGTNSVAQERTVLNFDINNRIEVKYFSKRDTTTKKFALMDNLSLGGNYVPTADSFKLSRITGIGRVSLFKNISSFNFNFSLDPYGRQLENGKERRIREWAIRTEKKLFVFERFSFGLTNSTTIPQVIRLMNGSKANKSNLPTFGSLFESFSISHQINYEFSRKETGVDTFYQSVNSISANGAIPLTSKWNITFGSIGYDFKNKSLTYPDFGFERDLHCWRMTFHYYPLSKAFQFFIGVKPGSLEFIKIPNNRNLVGGGF